MRRWLFGLLLALGCALWSACAAPASPGTGTPAAAGEAVAPQAANRVPDATDTRAEVVFLGDSLTAGLGLDTPLSFPSLIQQRIDERGWPFVVVNAGVSGDTSAGGLRRLEWSLQGRPRVLVVALGGNDALRGLPPEDLQKNLAAIIEGGRQAGAAVILAGMEAPPNNGPDYTARFRRVYRDLAGTYRIPLVPFLLDGVAGEPSLNQADGIHPNADGARRVAETVWQALEPVLSESLTTR